MHILQRRCAGQQIEALENETQLAIAEIRQGVARKGSDVDTVDEALALRGAIQATDGVHQRALAGTRRPHDGDKLARFHRQVHPADRPDLDLAGAVGLLELL